jgi:hypothetical protein
VLKSKSALFRELIERHGLHVVVAGMNGRASTAVDLQLARERAGVLDGEIRAKFSPDTLDVPPDRVTYMRGLGYAAELEIAARTRFQIMMPSGFSEPVWLMNRSRTLLVDPPPVYLLKLIKYRMPLFDNRHFRAFMYNNRRCHRPAVVVRELRRRGLISASTHSGSG